MRNLPFHLTILVSNTKICANFHPVSLNDGLVWSNGHKGNRTTEDKSKVVFHWPVHVHEISKLMSRNFGEMDHAHGSVAQGVNSGPVNVNNLAPLYLLPFNLCRVNYMYSALPVRYSSKLSSIILYTGAWCTRIPIVIHTFSQWSWTRWHIWYCQTDQQHIWTLAATTAPYQTTNRSWGEVSTSAKC